MKPKTKAHTPAPAGQGVRVCLCLTHPTARQIGIAGSFNEWQSEASPMFQLSDGTWATELVLAPGHHEYRFVVDGEWADDPTAADYVPNPFGGMNAALTVSAPEPLPASPRRISARSKSSTVCERA